MPQQTPPIKPSDPRYNLAMTRPEFTVLHETLLGLRDPKEQEPQRIIAMVQRRMDWIDEAENVRR